MSNVNSFPDNPGPNELARLDRDDGSYVIYRWDVDNSAWRIVGGSKNDGRPPIFSNDEPTVHPDLTAPDNALIAGDIWYQTNDDDNSVIKHVYDGTEWLVMNNEGFQTTATLPLATQPTDLVEDPESRARLVAKLEDQDTLMQSDLNEETFYSLFNQKRKQTRGSTRTNFINKTRIEDEWEYDAAGQNGSLPESGKFHLFQNDGQPTSHWKDVSEVSINGTGRNTATLSTVRKGSTLEIQDVLLNTYAQYIVTNVEVIGSIQGGQFWLNLDVKAAYDQALGLVPDGAVCEIQVSSPHPCITTSGSGEPVVDEDGYLWYNEINQKLYVSDWEDQQDNNGIATWIEVGGAGNSGGGVFVGEFPPTQDLEQGRLWFDTGRLELFVWYVEGEDGSWLPSSPLGARVSAGEILQAEINTRLGAVETDFVSKKGSSLTGSLQMQGGTEASGSHIYMLNKGFIRFGYDGGTDSMYGGYIYMRDENTFEIGSYQEKTLQFKGPAKFDNLTTIDRASGTAFKVKKSGVDHVKIEAGGKIFCNYNMELDDDDTTVPNKGWVKSRLPKFTDAEYGSNRLCKYGISTTVLDTGEVMFLGKELASVTAPNGVRAIAFSLSDFNWDSCIKSGVVKVNVGANNAGFYQVYDLKINGGRNAILYVEPIKWDDTYILEEDTGTPVYFQGVFFE